MFPSVFIGEITFSQPEMIDVMSSIVTGTLVGAGFTTTDKIELALALINS